MVNGIKFVILFISNIVRAQLELYQGKSEKKTLSHQIEFIEWNSHSNQMAVC